MRLSIDSKEKPEDIRYIKRLHQNKTRSIGSAGKGLDPNFAIIGTADVLDQICLARICDLSAHMIRYGHQFVSFPPLHPASAIQGDAEVINSWEIIDKWGLLVEPIACYDKFDLTLFSHYRDLGWHYQNLKNPILIITKSDTPNRHKYEY